MSEAEGIPAAEKIGEGAGANQACSSCVVLRNEKRKLNNTVKSLRKKLLEKRKEFAKMEKKLEGKFFFRSGLCYYLYEKICCKYSREIREMARINAPAAFMQVGSFSCHSLSCFRK